MTTKHKPATALPWEATRRDDPSGKNWICSDVGQAVNLGGLVVTRTLSPAANGFEDAAYIAHACNAYPKLIEALRSMEQWARDLSEQSDANALDGLERLRREHCLQYNDARALLRELGEDA